MIDSKRGQALAVARFADDGPLRPASTVQANAVDRGELALVGGVAGAQTGDLEQGHVLGARGL